MKPCTIRSQTTNLKLFIHKFFSSNNLPLASDTQKELLNRPIPREEIIRLSKAYKITRPPVQGILVDPLLKILSYSFESGALPDTMLDANISLILKKAKPADDCASYRLIALLDVDRKLLAKILAKRFEGVLPALSSGDDWFYIRSQFMQQCKETLEPLTVKYKVKGQNSCVLPWHREGLWQDWVALSAGCSHKI